MLSEPVEDVVFGRLFTFLPPTRVSQLRPIDDRPKPRPSSLNYPANVGTDQSTIPINKLPWLGKFIKELPSHFKSNTSYIEQNGSILGSISNNCQFNIARVILGTSDFKLIFEVNHFNFFYVKTLLPITNDFGSAQCPFWGIFVQKLFFM